MFLQALLVIVAVASLGYCDAKNHRLPNGGEIKAVLVAGSNSFYNYRHQADVCHAYQILRKNGIPDENIIVMMYDDIAYSEENPDQGVIINRPGGPDVYKNVPKDYVGKDVNKENFFNVLLGKKDSMNGIGSGRVLESGPNDHVFINFVDHGGPGVLLMPNEEILASQFLSVLETMANSSRFEKMFLYIEACESGSMFDNLLPDNLNIFVMTAADPHESSYACFYDDKLQTYLGDVFSVMWMEDSETVNLTTESVNHQFQKVRTETNTSHVEEYGDIDIGNTKLSEVIGHSDQLMPRYKLSLTDVVSAHHVPVAIVAHRINAAKNLEERNKFTEELHSILVRRQYVSQFFLKLGSEVLSPTTNNLVFGESMLARPAITKHNIGCFENAVTQLNEECFKISHNPFVTTHLHKLINLCEMMPETKVVETIKSLCHGKPKQQGII